MPVAVLIRQVLLGEREPAQAVTVRLGPPLVTAKAWGKGQEEWGGQSEK